MVKVNRGKDIYGKPASIYLDGYLVKTLDIAVDRVKRHKWDYVSLVCGITGSGKSTLARTIARYCCPWFDNQYIAFSGQEFVKITNEAEEYSAVILDESFQSLNSRVTMSPEFIRIINHLQIIRQKHLFVILCLPNYFDLTKGVAVFRASHLFVTYAADDGIRGRFKAFDRNKKRNLYVIGGKYMNYNCVQPNYVGAFRKNRDMMSEEVYEKMKYEHLMSQQEKLVKKIKKVDKLLPAVKNLLEKRFKLKEIAEILGISHGTLDNKIKVLKIQGKLPESLPNPNYLPPNSIKVTSPKLPSEKKTNLRSPPNTYNNTSTGDHRC